MTGKQWSIVGVVVILLLVGVRLTVAGSESISDRVFDLTGEESLNGQIGGLLQLPLNLTVPPLRTEPYADIAYADVNPFGVNTFLHHEVEEAKRVRQMELISEAGFHWIRQEFPWQDIEIHGGGDFIDRRNDPAGIDAWAKYDHIVELAETYDVEIIARLSSPPSWSRAADEEESGTFAPPDDLGDFARYAARLATRYKGRIRFYQVWNEPNIYPEWGEQAVNPEAYTDLLCRAYQAIKKADPDAVILSGALAPTAELSGRDLNDYIFLQRMYDAGAGACFDILSMQGYGLWSGPTDRRMRPLVVNYGRNQLVRDIMVRNGDAHKSIWISEMNWNVAPENVFPAYGRVTLDQQARWAPLAYQRAQEEWPWIGVINMWYFKRASDDWLQERRPEAYFQMLEPDFTPLPIYESIKAYANQPPVLYAGNHGADHYAITYSDSWTPVEKAGGVVMQSSDGGATARFMFDGSFLQVKRSEEANQSTSTITYKIDDGPTGQITGCCLVVTLYQGARGKHQVEIETQGKVVVAGYVIRDDPPLTAPLMIGGILVLGGAAYAARRRRVQDEGRHESET